MKSWILIMLLWYQRGHTRCIVLYFNLRKALILYLGCLLTRESHRRYRFISHTPCFETLNILVWSMYFKLQLFTWYYRCLVFFCWLCLLLLLFFLQLNLSLLINNFHNGISFHLNIFWWFIILIFIWWIEILIIISRIESFILLFLVKIRVTIVVLLVYLIDIFIHLF